MGEQSAGGHVRDAVTRTPTARTPRRASARDGLGIGRALVVDATRRSRARVEGVAGANDPSPDRSRVEGGLDVNSRRTS